MKLSANAIHEAGHSIIAMAYGFPVEEVYATDNDGYTKVALPLLSEKPLCSDELRSFLFSHLRNTITRQGFPDIDEETKKLIDEICNVVDFYLAGWLAEATLNPPQDISESEGYWSGDAQLISRASKDILDIWNMFGLPVKNRDVLKQIFLETHVNSLLSFMGSERLRRDIRNIYFLDRFMHPALIDKFSLEIDEEFHDISQWLLLRQHLLFVKHFCHSGTRKQCIALSKRLMKKSSLSGSEAADTIRKIEAPKAVNSLIRDLKDKDWRIREAAIWALRELGNAKTTKSLMHALKDKNSTVRWSAVWALGELRDIKIVEPLIRALQDESLTVREAAAIALGKTGAIRAVEPLTQALQDKDVSVRWEAKYALRNIETKGRRYVPRRRRRTSKDT